MELGSEPKLSVSLTVVYYYIASRKFLLNRLPLVLESFSKFPFNLPYLCESICSSHCYECLKLGVESHLVVHLRHLAEPGR